MQGDPVVFDGSSQNDSTRLEAAGAITLGSKLKPGTYILQIVVRDKNAKKNRSIATQWVEFEITG